MGTVTATTSFQMATLLIFHHSLSNTKARANVWQSKRLTGASAGKEFLDVKDGANSSPPPDTEVLFPC